jgi:hypothetical protein
MSSVVSTPAGIAEFIRQPTPVAKASKLTL